MVDGSAPEGAAYPDSSAHDDVIGKTVANNYYLLRRIGSGGMGRVYEAEQLSLGKRVAVKILRREFMADDRALTRFELEARAAAAVNHPNLVQIFDCGRDDELNLVYIAMELLPGVDLSVTLHRDWPIPLERTVHIIDDVLSGMDEAHTLGIIHRDLKPGNIMLVPRRNQTDLVKVLDFGIAKAPPARHPHSPTLAGFVFGTPEYMSPEQARGAVVDGRTDLYAVGAILYQLLTGDVPFNGPSPTDVLVRLLRDEPERPSLKGKIEIPRALEDLLMRALAKRPEDRPQTAAQFRDELRASLVGVVDSWPGQTGTMMAAGKATLPPPRSRPFGKEVQQIPATLGAAQPLHAPTTTVSAVPSLLPRSRPWVWLLACGLAVAGGAVYILKPNLTLGGWNTVARVRNEAPSSPAVTTSVVVSKSAPAEGSASGNVKDTVAKAPGTPRQEVALEDTKNLAPDRSVDSEPPGASEATGPGSSHARKVAPRPRVDRNVKHPPPPERRSLAPARAEAGQGILGPSGGASALVAPAAPVTPPSPVQPAVVVGDNPPPALASNGREEPLKEGERLLGQGDVINACRQGEEARRVSPRSPAVYKFLGKCYMRAGKTAVAADNYRRYLQLAPDAPDAEFIRSYVK